MKKILVTVAVSLMTAMGVNAQNEELRHEVSVFYGGPSISHLGSAFGELVGLVFSNAESPDISFCVIIQFRGGVISEPIDDLNLQLARIDQCADVSRAVPQFFRRRCDFIHGNRRNRHRGIPFVLSHYALPPICLSGIVEIYVNGILNV